MQSLGGALQQLKNRSVETLPNDSQCPVCEYFDLAHPEVARILYARDPRGHVYNSARCRCKEKAEALTAQRVNQANLPNRTGGPRTFDNYRIVAGKDGLEACRRFAEGEGPGLLTLTGPVGTGKSHLLEAVIRATLDDGRRARYEKVTTWLERLRNSYEASGEQSFYNLLQWYGGFQVLALDDLGMERMTPWAQERITDIIDDALVRQRRLILATNLSRSQARQHAGDRVASRLFGTSTELGEARVVAITGEDYRRLTTGQKEQP